MITFRGVLAEEVGIWWPKVEGWIAEALEHGPGLYAPEDVLEDLAGRRMQLWVTCEGAEPIGCVTTSVQQFPRRRVLMIGAIGGVEGRGVEWIRGMDELLKAYALSEGCTAQMSEGRRGWDRFVGNGWQAVTQNFFREIG